MTAIPGPIQVPPDDPHALRTAIDAALRSPRPNVNRAARYAWSTLGRDHARWARWLMRQASPN
jgi:hypothetical protein